MISFTRQQLQDSWTERFSVLIPNASDTNLKAKVRQYLDLLPEVKRGDKLSLLSSEVGLTLALNGQRLGVVENLQFSRLVLSSWFGDQPASAELKSAVFSGANVLNLPCSQ
jgi:Chalcone isomerase-like